MSAFLGPIHYWLWNKIKVQDEMTKQLSAFAKDVLHKEELQQELQNEYGKLEEGDLEDIIDGGNIHGWLQARVTLVERMFAKAVDTILKEDEKNLAKLQDLLFVYGKQIGAKEDLSVKEAFKLLQDTLLDGMPCDHANQVLEETAEKMVWKRVLCVHKPYWDEIGVDTANYYVLRESFTKGLLENTKIIFRKKDETTSEITTTLT
jgi:hypothetical protein